MAEPGPVYQWIADDLMRQIDEGLLKPESPIPSRSRLKEAYRASDQTVDRAVRVLKAAGYVEGQFGRGVFVVDRSARATLDRGTGAVDSPFAARVVGDTTEVDWEASTVTTTAPPAIAERLVITAGDPVVMTRYEYLANRRPVQLATSWEPLAITDGTDVAHPERGPYARRGVRGRLAAIGVRVVRAREILESRPATGWEAQALGCAQGQCVTAVQRTYFDADDRAVETSDTVIRADRWRVAYSIDFSS
ncbi:GntR family transcriptional regulator [Actinacidiphila glaucinigra]|uniref:GntR family transcriptional regulator n=1 Tax=Actinacidiphila glaucinigra TaxID=235986 RepID=UPI00325019DE